MAAEEGEYGDLGFGEKERCEEGDLDGDSSGRGDSGGVWVEMVVGVWQERRHLGLRWWDEENVT